MDSHEIERLRDSLLGLLGLETASAAPADARMPLVPAELFYAGLNLLVPPRRLVPPERPGDGEPRKEIEMPQDRSTKRNGLEGFLTGLGSLVEGLGDLMEKVQAAGGEIRREGQLGSPAGKDGTQAVYGFSLRMGLPGSTPRVEPFGNVRRDGKGDPVVTESREPLADVFEEPDRILVVAELPGLAEDDIHLELQGDILVLRAEGQRNKFYKEFWLPCRPSVYTSSLHNGILEVSLPRPEAARSAAPAASEPEPEPGSSRRRPRPRGEKPSRRPARR